MSSALLALPAPLRGDPLFQTTPATSVARRAIAVLKLAVPLWERSTLQVLASGDRLWTSCDKSGGAT